MLPPVPPAEENPFLRERHVPTEHLKGACRPPAEAIDVPIEDLKRGHALRSVDPLCPLPRPKGGPTNRYKDPRLPSLLVEQGPSRLLPETPPVPSRVGTSDILPLQIQEAKALHRPSGAYHAPTIPHSITRGPRVPREEHEPMRTHFVHSAAQDVLRDTGSPRSPQRAERGRPMRAYPIADTRQTRTTGQPIPDETETESYECRERPSCSLIPTRERVLSPSRSLFRYTPYSSP